LCYPRWRHESLRWHWWSLMLVGRPASTWWWLLRLMMACSD
jgi:hypothetical protein